MVNLSSQNVKPVVAAAAAVYAGGGAGVAAAGDAIMSTELGLKASFTVGMANQLLGSRAKDAMLRGGNFLLQHPVEVNQAANGLLSGVGPDTTGVIDNYIEFGGFVVGKGAMELYNEK